MFARHIGMVVGALGLGLTLVFLRGEPRWNSDQGVFLSIAARLLDGDRLYSEVIDNKEPFFLYTYAGALWVGGWRGPAALDGVWFALAAVSCALLLRELNAPKLAVVAGFFIYPLALTASWYEPGLSMLGGLAIAPLAAWLWLRRRFAASGVALGVTLGFKLSLALVAAAPMAAFVLIGVPLGSRIRHVAHAALGLFATLGAIALVLGIRGELGKYVEIIAFNIQYPDGAQRSQGGSGGIASHLEIVKAFFVASGRWQAPAAVLAVGVFVLSVLFGLARSGRAFLSLYGAATAALAAAVVTLGLTAIWFHHLQMLAFPAVLIAAVVISVVSSSLGRTLGVVAATACVLFAAWSSVKHEVHGGLTARSWSSGPSSVGAELLEDVRVRTFARDEQVTYMVFGGNSDNAHAVFIDDAFELVCRWFHLYPSNAEEQLVETLGCANAKTPELVLVTVGFLEPRQATPEWDSFVAGARRFLDARYELVRDRDRFQVWERRSAAGTG